MKLISTKNLFAALIFAAASNLFALEAKDVIQMSHDVKKPEFTIAAIQMDLYLKGGALQESRQVKEYGREKNDLTSMVMTFISPASVKDTRFLVSENPGKQADDKFIYLPSLKQTRRIATSDGSKSFVGTDASYDDMSSRDVDEDNHEFVNGEEMVEKNGYKCWLIKSTPKDPSSSQYLYRINYIDQNTKYPIYTEMYDKKGKLLKTLTLEKLQNVAGVTGNKYDIPMQEYMVNVQSGHSTRLTIKNIKVDSPIPDRVFTQNFLSTGK